ncbi:PREDICTED: protein Flattop [Calidris pugnax]|uniref:protein Flattop n=1 Tax=Calidris pugnax TaxID=198806 RepID=UPI00071D55D9|nr:PREDICTED: protein Flattop [Calidris pugnax]
MPRSQVSPWGTFVGTWEMPPRIPPARLNLTSRSAAAAGRLTDWIHRPTTLTHACNGIRTHVTGKPQPDAQTTKEPPRRSSRAPAEGVQQPEEPPGPGAGPTDPLSQQSSRTGVRLEGDTSPQPPAPHRPCSQQDKLRGQTPCSHQPAVTDPQHGNPGSPQIPASVPPGTSPGQTAPTRVPTASPGGKSPGLRASRA